MQCNLFIWTSVSLTLSCPMNLKLYPLDRQTCTLSMISCKLCINTYFNVNVALINLLMSFILTFFGRRLDDGRSCLYLETHRSRSGG
jgi:hypothetical protein